MPRQSPSHRRWRGRSRQETPAEQSGPPPGSSSFFWVKFSLLAAIACIPLVGTPLVIVMLPCAPRRYGRSFDGSDKWISVGIALIIISAVTIAGTGLFEVLWKGFTVFKDFTMSVWTILFFVTAVEMTVCAIGFYRLVFKHPTTLVTTRSNAPSGPPPVYGAQGHERDARVSIPTQSRRQSAAPSYRNSWRQSQQEPSGIELEEVSSHENSSDQDNRRRSSTSRHSSIRSLINRTGSGSRPPASRSSSHRIAHSSEEEPTSSEEDREFPLNIHPDYNAPSRHSSTRRGSVGDR